MIIVYFDVEAYSNLKKILRIYASKVEDNDNKQIDCLDYWANDNFDDNDKHILNMTNYSNIKNKKCIDHQEIVNQFKNFIKDAEKLIYFGNDNLSKKLNY